MVRRIHLQVALGCVCEGLHGHEVIPAQRGAVGLLQVGGEAPERLPGEGLGALLAVGDAQPEEAPARLLILRCSGLQVLHSNMQCRSNKLNDQNLLPAVALFMTAGCLEPL